MTTMTLTADTTPRHPNDPIFLGVCAEIATTLRLPTGQVRIIAAAAIVASLVIPGLIAYVVLGHSLRSRRKFRRTRQQSARLARADGVLMAYLAEKRARRDDAARPANDA
jgi:phage shock protein PspC (stress-responsive transcriptional regulator)